MSAPPRNTQLLRIALVCARYRPSTGGVQTHVAKLASGLVERGHEVTVLTHRLHADQRRFETSDGVRIERFNRTITSEHLAISKGLVSAIRRGRERFDVLHAHSYHDSPALIASVAWTGPLVFTPHYHGESSDPVRQALHIPYRLLAANIFRRSERTLCVSGAERDAIQQDFARSTGVVELASNGVARTRIRNAYPLRPTPQPLTQVAYIGRLEDYKQVDLLVRAAAILRRTHRFHIIGQGPERPYLERLARDHDLDEVVEFHGRLLTQAVYGFLRGSEIIVSPSRIEAQGIGCLEALAAGANVVASDIAPHRELRRNYPKSVTTFDVRDGVPALVDALWLATVAPRREHDVPTWEDLIDTVERTYYSVIQRTLPAPDIDHRTIVPATAAA